MGHLGNHNATTHGMKNTPEYSAWCSMRARCKNKSASHYQDYGGRGIVVCERWNTFENFYADMGPRPSPNHSIDRKDNNGNYEPSNCRWATKEIQFNNRRTCIFLTHNGITMTAAQWTRKMGWKARKIHVRLRRGWSVSEALDTP
jgi:hypothetical protein